MKQVFKNNYGLIILIGLALLVMTVAAMVDQKWTIAISHMASPRLVAFMADSIFEGEALGANDLVMFFLLGSAVAYYVGWRHPRAKTIASWRPQTGFILTSALVAGVYAVHGLKWMMGRARPDLIVEQKVAFSHWFTLGPLFVTDGVYSGAFPSGHTAQTFLLMAVAYALAADPLVSKPARIAGWLWGVLALALSLTMGVTRCMTLSHWLTDILGAIFIGAIGMHLLYFKVLRVPDQRRYMDRHGQLPELPQVWELILCLYLLAATIGVMMLMIGTRAIWIPKATWLATMIPIGAALIWVAWQKSATLLRRVRQTLSMPALNS